MEKNFEYFKAKETRIKNAIERVKKRLLEFKQYNDQIDELCDKEGRTWTQEELNNLNGWNDLHELQDRLEDRLRDNFVDYQEYCFETNGFCAF